MRNRITVCTVLAAGFCAGGAMAAETTKKAPKGLVNPALSGTFQPAAGEYLSTTTVRARNIDVQVSSDTFGGDFLEIETLEQQIEERIQYGLTSRMTLSLTFSHKTNTDDQTYSQGYKTAVQYQTAQALGIAPDLVDIGTVDGTVDTRGVTDPVIDLRWSETAAGMLITVGASYSPDTGKALEGDLERAGNHRRGGDETSVHARISRRLFTITSLSLSGTVTTTGKSDSLGNDEEMVHDPDLKLRAEYGFALARSVVGTVYYERDFQGKDRTKVDGATIGTAKPEPLNVYFAGAAYAPTPNMTIGAGGAMFTQKSTTASSVTTNADIEGVGYGMSFGLRM